jgi:hypothetical protein
MIKSIGRLELMSCRRNPAAFASRLNGLVLRGWVKAGG